MNQDIINQIKELLTPVASKMGESAEFGWEVVVRQQYVGAIIVFSTILLSVITGIIALVLSKKVKDWDTDMPTVRQILVLLIGFVSVVGIIYGFAFCGEAIGKLINPEYYALEFFINLVK